MVFFPTFLFLHYSLLKIQSKKYNKFKRRYWKQVRENILKTDEPVSSYKSQSSSSLFRMVLTLQQMHFESNSTFDECILHCENHGHQRMISTFESTRMKYSTKTHQIPTSHPQKQILGRERERNSRATPQMSTRCIVTGSNQRALRITLDSENEDGPRVADSGCENEPTTPC